jgi:hypothetical protein
LDETRRRTSGSRGGYLRQGKLWGGVAKSWPTLSRAVHSGEAEIEIAEPALYAWEAHAQAEEAKQRAKQVDALRKALPRNKPSPKLTKAMRFVEKYDIRKLNKQIIMKARRKGITRSTLQRALYYVSNNNSI